VKRYVVDASVVVKWFIEEDGSERAENIRVAFIKKEVELICPSLLQFEVLNALKYSGLFTKAELLVAAESIENYPFTRQVIKGDVQAKMVEVAVDHDLSMYDAAYVSLAISEKEPLVTADEKLQKKLPATLESIVKSLSAF
jgi:predicted nucleic acid-binding protein